MNKVTLMSLSLALITGTLVLGLPSAEARHWGYGVNGRQARQQSRINSGIGSGTLTGREAYRLNKQQRALNRQEQFYRSTGNGLSNRERARLEREQNQLSHNIYNQKHDGQDRMPGPANGWGNPPGHGIGNPPGTSWGNPPGVGPGNPPGTGWGNHHNYYNRGVNARQENQQERLSNGLQSGSLTQKEYDRLQNQQSNLASLEAKYRDSGSGLNPYERARLDAAQDALSRNINRQAHDNQHN
ncbi:MAG TPA: hypothetical protein PKZ32_07305 [Candidatus Melainabacteria bacterium]|nr:hypothetical protein [Candidatus Melainabacteria bacterium]